MPELFDTLDYVKGAEEIGIKREHAEYAAKKLSSIVQNQVITKITMETMEKTIAHDIKHLEKHLDQKMMVLEQKIITVQQQIVITEHKLMFRLGGLMIVCSGIITGILGFIIKL